VKRWTKRDVRTLIQQLASWWLFNAPYARQGVTAEHVFSTMPTSVRVGIVANGLRGWIAMTGDRAAQNSAAAAHYRGVWSDTGTPRDPTGEMVQRFTNAAMADTASAVHAQKLLDRVASDGLPPEVAAWMPDR
jgi:hypothetical protein